VKISAGDLFAAAARIIGILVIIKGVEVLIMTVPAVLGLYGQSMPDWVLSQRIITLIYPLVLILAGSYLLSGTSGLVEKLYPDEDEKAFASARSVFRLAMRITGMILIVYGVPELLQVLSGALYAGYYHRFGIDTSAQVMMAAERSLAVIVSLLFGFHLLKSGRYFERLAFREECGDESSRF
jgi:uncharacterized protein YjeT (DUF2065 family)